MSDASYRNLEFRRSEVKHGYGDNVHLVHDPYLFTLLARLCSPETKQPVITQLVEKCYRGLFQHVINAEFPLHDQDLETRMIEHCAEAVLSGAMLNPACRAVCVNIARAGTVPSQLCYQMLNELIDPDLVRQDHLIMNRVVDSNEQVTGASLSGSKIGGDVDQAMLIFPDPMAATGSSLALAMDHYRKEVAGTPAKILNLHLIVTPEYLKTMKREHPEAIVYALRLDRGMSSPEILKSGLGEFWDQEVGLNDQQYIVPGGGGFGEILNNSFV